MKRRKDPDERTVSPEEVRRRARLYRWRSLARATGLLPDGTVVDRAGEDT